MDNMMNEKETGIEEIKLSVLTRTQDLKKQAEELHIDEFDLDSESLKTPRLHSKWLSVLGEEAYRLKQFNNVQSKLYLERWRYYNGTQDDKYYQKHGIVHHKILKTDLDMYMKADKYMCAMSEVVVMQECLVNFLEKTVKEITSRTYHIKSAIDWRRFQSGS